MLANSAAGTKDGKFWSNSKLYIEEYYIWEPE